jgi:hypothetical protein
MIQRIATVFAAAGTVDNVVAGRSIEFAAEDSSLTIAAATTVAGATMSVRLTDEVVMDDSVVPVAAAPAPILPDHILLQRQAMARGDHLIVRVTVTAAATVTTLVEVAPL